jgi:hypothetical protein
MSTSRVYQLCFFAITYRPEYPNLTMPLNNLAQLLKATNRLAETESLMRRLP